MRNNNRSEISLDTGNNPYITMKAVFSSKVRRMPACPTWSKPLPSTARKLFFHALITGVDGSHWYSQTQMLNLSLSVVGSEHKQLPAWIVQLDAKYLHLIRAARAEAAQPAMVVTCHARSQTVVSIHKSWLQNLFYKSRKFFELLGNCLSYVAGLWIGATAFRKLAWIIRNLVANFGQVFATW